MSKPDSESEVGEPRAEYDFAAGERGKYAARYSEGTNLVPIAVDLLDVFPDAEAVDKALREVAAARRQEAG